MDKPKVRLLADRVLVKVIKHGDTLSRGGIIIPDSAAKEAALRGIVLGVSARVTKCAVEEDKVYEDEIVLFSKYAGTDLNYKNDEYKILRITDIIGAEED